MAVLVDIGNESLVRLPPGSFVNVPGPPGLRLELGPLFVGELVVSTAVPAHPCTERKVVDSDIARGDPGVSVIGDVLFQLGIPEVPPRGHQPHGVQPKRPIELISARGAVGINDHQSAASAASLTRSRIAAAAPRPADFVGELTVLIGQRQQGAVDVPEPRTRHLIRQVTGVIDQHRQHNHSRVVTIRVQAQRPADALGDVDLGGAWRREHDAVEGGDVYPWLRHRTLDSTAIPLSPGFPGCAGRRRAARWTSMRRYASPSVRGPGRDALAAPTAASE